MKIDLYQGEQADFLLGSDAFRAQWSALCAQCPWATAWQTPQFIFTWYSIYRDAFEPLLVLCRDADGRLQGALPLAVCHHNNQLVPAGTYHAEYQVWICLPHLAKIFPHRAFQLLRAQIPEVGLKLHHLPPHTPLDWLADSPVGRTCLLRACQRPSMRIDDSRGIARAFSKRNNKNRLRQLERLGPLQFDCITDPARLEAIFDVVARCCDVRRMAINGLAPFGDDPLKRPLHLAMMAAGLLHVTLLQVGDQIAAVHLNPRAGKQYHLGLHVYNPLLARYSPGVIHMLFLMDLLSREGYERVDLTPGDEPYKQRLATTWEPVHTLALFPSAYRRTRAAIHFKAEQAARNILKKLDVAPAQAKSFALDVKRNPAVGPATFLRSLSAHRGCHRPIRIYSRDAKKAMPLDAGEPIHRDDLDDLLAYRPRLAQPSRRQFISMALDRLAEGHHLYTHAENGRLLHYGWLVDRPAGKWMNRVLPGLTLPPNSALIFGFRTFTQGRQRGLATASLSAMLHDAARVPQTERIFIAVPAGSSAARNLVEKLGFTREYHPFKPAWTGRLRWPMKPSPASATPPNAADAPAGQKRDSSNENIEVAYEY